MFEHLLFIIFIYLIIFSIIGYGYIFLKITRFSEINNLNFGYYGISGLFFVSLISILTSFFMKHDYFHNIILHFIGLLSFVYFYNFNKEKFYPQLKKLILLSLILILGIYIFKNHDDFPYYHLTYSLYLTENKYLIGAGLFGHGFRTFSSIFYFNSITNLPLIKYFLFNIGQFLVLLFFNFLILDKIFKEYKKKNFLTFFCLLSFIFVNVVFYRIAEHGTDRSSQILLLLIFIIFFDLTIFNKNNYNFNLKFLIILISFAASIKSIYFLYFLLLPILFFKDKKILNILNYKNLLFNFSIVLFFISIISINIFNTGCALYPSSNTCFKNLEWSFSKKQVNKMKIHYEWWSKAGGGPSYQHKLSKEDYVKNFTWLKNWIDRHFFNKVSDTLLGIIAISLIVFFIFRSNKKVKAKPPNYFLYYLISIVYLGEWFLNHPAMRYGGFVLFAIPIFIFTSQILERYQLKEKDVFKKLLTLVIITFVIFNSRNILRIHKEISIYKYNILASPFFYIPKVENKIIFDNGELKIYRPINNMCWNLPTPCSNRGSLKVKRYLNTFMILKDDQ